MAQPNEAIPSRRCAVVAYIESGALFLYCILLSIAAINSSGATTSAPIVEIVIYLVFAAGIFFIARGMWAHSINARAPYFVTQIFVVIVGYTVFAGDGTVVKVVGALVGLLGIVGIGLGVLMVMADSPRAVDRVEADPDGPEATL